MGLHILKRMQRLQGGVSSVSDEEYDRQLDTQFERDLRRRRFKPIKGPQFDPKNVPTFQDINSGQMIFDPNYSSSDDPIYAQSGRSDVVNPDPESGQTMFALPLGFAPPVDNSGMFPRRVPPAPRMNTWADYFERLIEQAKQDEIDPDMVLNPPTERPPDEGKWGRLQSGTEQVPNPEGYQRDDVYFRSGYTPSSKEESRLYDPGPPAPPSAEDLELEREKQANRESVYGTIGININGKETEVPLWYQGMTPEEADDAARARLEVGLSPFASLDQLKDEQGRLPQNQQLGTSNIMNGPVPQPNPAANPGMRLLMAMQKLRRPQGMTKPRRFPPKQAMPPTAMPPQGFAKGSSGIHIKPSHKGLFTAKAKGAGMGVQQYASKVLSGGSKASAATRRQANFARNAAKWNR